VGRRRLLLISLFGMFVTLALLGLTFVAELASALSLVAMVLYICAFAVGLGPVFWVLIGEIFPARVKSVGSGAATTVNWLANFVVSLVFLSVANAIGQGETFWLFALVCAFGLWFIGRFVPETRDREFADFDGDLQARFHRSGRASQPG
jgi:MFS family permease